MMFGLLATGADLGFAGGMERHGLELGRLPDVMGFMMPAWLWARGQRMWFQDAIQVGSTHGEKL